MTTFLKTNIFCSVLLLLVTSASIGQNLLNNPESVVFDSTYNRYLVSNWGEGDGTIVQIDSNGGQSYFSTVLAGQFKIAGLYIYNNILLAATGDAPDAGVTGFDMETGDTLFHIMLPGVGLPNDITSDSNGIIYVTDYWDDKLYKIENEVPAIYIDQGINNPNGVLYDQLHHRLLVISVLPSGSLILAINLDDGSVSTVVDTGIPSGDGITMDADRNVYFSEWAGDAVHQYDSTFSNPPVLFSTGHNDPADIYYDKINKLLAVPNFSSNTVDFIQLTTTIIENNNVSTPEKFVLIQNYPNPFQQSTTIKYSLSAASHLKLTITGSLGILICTVVNKKQQKGEYEIIWDGTDDNGNIVPNGIYYCKAQESNNNQIFKIIKINNQ